VGLKKLEISKGDKGPRLAARRGLEQSSQGEVSLPKGKRETFFRPSHNGTSWTTNQVGKKKFPKEEGKTAEASKKKKQTGRRGCPTGGKYQESERALRRQ